MVDNQFWNAYKRVDDLQENINIADVSNMTITKMVASVVEELKQLRL